MIAIECTCVVRDAGSAQAARRAATSYREVIQKFPLQKQNSRGDFIQFELGENNYIHRIKYVLVDERDSARRTRGRKPRYCLRPGRRTGPYQPIPLPTNSTLYTRNTREGQAYCEYISARYSSPTDS
ncbi:unnamed protein product [Euphydryas editha]|uniref:Uncharacterized protein n=1 Tax=Euphydryas editha TaxID=104508 RepID=A0AAU9TGF6_EUPED|nr:unnamed protein product [Euphydryas editha]